MLMQNGVNIIACKALVANTYLPIYTTTGNEKSTYSSYLDSLWHYKTEWNDSTKDGVYILLGEGNTPTGLNDIDMENTTYNGVNVNSTLVLSSMVGSVSVLGEACYMGIISNPTDNDIPYREIGLFVCVTGSATTYTGDFLIARNVLETENIIKAGDSACFCFKINFGNVGENACITSAGGICMASTFNQVNSSYVNLPPIKNYQGTELTDLHPSSTNLTCSNNNSLTQNSTRTTARVGIGNSPVVTSDYTLTEEFEENNATVNINSLLQLSSISSEAGTGNECAIYHLYFKNNDSVARTVYEVGVINVWGSGKFFLHSRFVFPNGIEFAAGETKQFDLMYPTNGYIPVANVT